MAGILDLIGALTGVSKTTGGLTTTNNPDGTVQYGYNPVSVRNPQWDKILSGGRGADESDRLNNAILPMLLQQQEARATQQLLEGLRAKSEQDLQAARDKAAGERQESVNRTQLRGQRMQNRGQLRVEKQRGQSALDKAKQDAAIAFTAKYGLPVEAATDLYNIIKEPRIEAAGRAAETERDLTSHIADNVGQLKAPALAGEAGRLVRPWVDAQAAGRVNVPSGTTALLNDDLFNPGAAPRIFRGMMPVVEQEQVEGGFAYDPATGKPIQTPARQSSRSYLNPGGFVTPTDPAKVRAALEGTGAAGAAAPSAGDLFTPNLNHELFPVQRDADVTSFLGLSKPAAIPTIQQAASGDDPVGLPPELQQAFMQGLKSLGTNANKTADALLVNPLLRSIAESLLSGNR